MDPRYTRIVEDLRRGILGGRMAPGSRVPSQYSLAESYGVTKETANKALTILAAEGLLVRRRGAAGTVVASPSSRQAKAIGFLMTLFPTPFYSRMLQGACAATFRRGYGLQFIEWPAQEDAESLWAQMQRSGLAGLLVTHGAPAADLPFPVLHVNQEPAPSAKASFVNPDNRDAGYQVGRLLMEHGHRDVVYVTKPLSRAIYQSRWEGFARALAERGVPARGRVFEISTGTERSVPAILAHCLADFPGLTAVVFYEDGMAASAAHILMEQGVAVPERMSLACVGLNRTHDAFLRLTGAEFHPFTLGESAATALLDIVERKRKGPIQVTLPIEIVQGTSVARLPGRRR